MGMLPPQRMPAATQREPSPRALQAGARQGACSAAFASWVALAPRAAPPPSWAALGVHRARPSGNTIAVAVFCLIMFSRISARHTDQSIDLGTQTVVNTIHSHQGADDA